MSKDLTSKTAPKDTIGENRRFSWLIDGLKSDNIVEREVSCYCWVKLVESDPKNVDETLLEEMIETLKTYAKEKK